MSDYIITIDENGSPSLAHYGVLGMKWGVRHNPQKAYSKSKKKAEKYQKKIDKQDAKARKQLGKGAARASRFLFRSQSGAQRAYDKSRRHTAKAVRQAQKGAKWINRMEKEFSKQSTVSVEQSVLDMGKAYTSRMSSMADRMYVNYL